MTDHRAAAIDLLRLADQWVEPDSRELLRESALWGALVHSILDIAAAMRCEDDPTDRLRQLFGGEFGAEQAGPN